MPDKSREQIWEEWNEVVNMSPEELEAWLGTEESKSVGEAGDAGPGGRAAGEKILEIRRTKKEDLSDAQWEHMRGVVGFVHRHCAQGGPREDLRHSPWRYALKNRGHDPLKNDGCA